LIQIKDTYQRRPRCYPPKTLATSLIYPPFNIRPGQSVFIVHDVLTGNFHPGFKGLDRLSDTSPVLFCSEVPGNAVTRAARSGITSQPLTLVTARPQSGDIEPDMTLFGRSSIEAAVAVGTIVLGTVIVHLIMSWWPALAALI